jgi:CheY-like chemotaxis protein
MPSVSDLLLPRILVVDDERPIHASVKLRLAESYELVFCFSGRDALKAIVEQRFDLCFADIHMPHMDGLTFIENAAKLDGNLGFVVLSAFDTDENLRKTIPLQVYDFIGKPLPERTGFESRIPEWVERTRKRRREHALAEQASVISRDLDSARLEREVELVASESARDALLQTANLLTTIHAHLVNASATLGTRVRTDHSLAHLYRGLEEARKIADAAVNVAEAFFDSGYGRRDSSRAVVEVGLKQAVNIAIRMTKSDEANLRIDYPNQQMECVVQGLTGIDFLLMIVPAVGAALRVAAGNSTIRIATDRVARIDSAVTDRRYRSFLWVNRRNSMWSQPGVVITISSAGAALSKNDAEAWLRGEPNQQLSALSARGLVAAVQKCKGLLAIATTPQSPQFVVVLALPT